MHGGKLARYLQPGEVADDRGEILGEHVRWALLAIAAVSSACFNPSYDRPMCGSHGECPEGLHHGIRVAALGEGGLGAAPELARGGPAVGQDGSRHLAQCRLQARAVFVVDGHIFGARDGGVAEAFAGAIDGGFGEDGCCHRAIVKDGGGPRLHLAGLT